MRAYILFERRSVILYNLVMIFFIINKTDNSSSQTKKHKKGVFYILFEHNLLNKTKECYLVQFSYHNCYNIFIINKADNSPSQMIQEKEEFCVLYFAHVFSIKGLSVILYIIIPIYLI